MNDYLLDCARCAALFSPRSAPLEAQGWSRHPLGGWQCPICTGEVTGAIEDLFTKMQEVGMGMNQYTLDKLDRERAATAAKNLSDYQAEVRRAHCRIVLCVVGLSVVVGLFLYFVK